ncbi:MAG: DUF4199 domain-containing protein [Saprospiraceae bacterium]|nr:DUF4199 domain-containing protein [Saprospiraceae bacterium]
MNNFSGAIRIGLIWGMGSIIFSLTQYLITGNQNTGLLLGIIIFLVGIAVMYLIGIQRRKQLNDYISWKEAMTHIWVGAIINTIIYTLFIFILNNYIDPDLKQKTIEAQIKMIEEYRGSMGDAVADAQIEKIENNDPFSFTNVLLILGGGVLVQFLFSCLVALVVKRDDPQKSGQGMKEIMDNL